MGDYHEFAIKMINNIDFFFTTTVSKIVVQL